MAIRCLTSPHATEHHVPILTSKSEDWRRYYDKTASRAPRETLLFALDRFEADGVQRFAVDLGCGDGRDTTELLRRGWSVLAVDSEPAAIEKLRKRGDLPSNATLRTEVGRFEEVRWPRAHLVNSSFALPLCPPAAFPGLWRRIVESLATGGRFAGQLYGDRDGWAGDPTITFLAPARVAELLQGLAVEYFREEEECSLTPRGAAKHWHIFHIVARKP